MTDPITYIKQLEAERELRREYIAALQAQVEASREEYQKIDRACQRLLDACNGFKSLLWWSDIEFICALLVVLGLAITLKYGC